MQSPLDVLSSIAETQSKILVKTEERQDHLEAAALVMRMHLTKGKEIEVFYAEDNAFYKATITRMERKGFAYKFEDNLKGRMLFKHLHTYWRFPLNDESIHYTADNILLVTRCHKKNRK